MELDPAGYFLIRINKGKIEAGFCKKDNIIEERFTGKDADLYKAILKKIQIQPEHAAYLGKELTKAEIALKLGIKYTQDAELPL